MGQQQYEKDIKKDEATEGNPDWKKDEVVKSETTETAKEEEVFEAGGTAPVVEATAETPEPTENGESKEESNPNTQE